MQNVQSNSAVRALAKHVMSDFERALNQLSQGMTDPEIRAQIVQCHLASLLSQSMVLSNICDHVGRSEQ